MLLTLGASILGKNRLFYSGVLDSATTAFISAASITNPTQISAIDTFIKGLKSENLWSKLYAFYPIVGSSIAQFSYNLKNPSTYQITWVDTPSVPSANRISFNGTTQYGNTGFSPIAVSGFSMSDISFGCFDSTGFNNRTEVPMGTTQNVGFDRIRAVWFSSNNNLLDIMSNDNVGARVVFGGQAIGHWHFQRLSTDTKAFFNGNIVGSSTSVGDVSVIPTNNFFLGASSDGSAGANTPALFSQKSYKYFYIAKALTDLEVTILNSLLNTFNSNLGR